jgi:outer membrane protein assembly factor BamB
MSKRIAVSECPNCCAPVDTSSIADPDNPSCPFCHTLLPVHEDPRPLEIPTFPASTGFPRLTRGSGSFKALIMAVVLVLVGVAVLLPIVLALGSRSTPQSAGTTGGTTGTGNTGDTGADYNLDGSVLLASSSASGDAYVVASDASADQGPVVREVNLETHRIVWSTTQLASQDSSTPTILSTPSLVVAIVGSDVFTFEASNGKRLWQSSLSYTLQTGCDTANCAVIVGASLVTLAADGTVQAFALSSGRQLWSRKLSDTPRFITEADGDAAVVSSPKPPAADLLLFDPQSGAVRTVAPACAPDGNGDLAVPSDDSGYFVSPDGRSLTVMVTGPGGCIIEYRLSDGKRLWRTASDAENSVIPATLTGESAVVGTRYLAWTNEVKTDRWIFTANLANGSLTRLIDTGTENGTTNIDGMIGNLLVAEVAPQQAPDEAGVYGVSLSSGEQQWMMASLVKSEDVDGSQLVLVTSAGITVAECQSSADGSTGSCKFEGIDPKSGDVNGTLNITSLDPGPDLSMWTGPNGEVLANVDSAMALTFNPVAGVEDGQWPYFG